MSLCALLFLALLSMDFPSAWSKNVSQDLVPANSTTSRLTTPPSPQYVGIIVPYFGKLPKWFPLFAKTAGYNAPYFTWFVFNDNITSRATYPPNVRVIPFTLRDFEGLVSKKLGLNLTLTSRKVCDFKVFYGHLFAEHLAKFDFWGYTDIDMFFGNISHFVSQSVLRQSDVVSSWSAGPIGPFSFYRLAPKVNELPFLLRNWRNHMKDVKHLVAFDEFLGHKDNIAKVVKRERRKRNLQLWYGYNPTHPATYIQDSMWFPCKRLHCNRHLPLGVRFMWKKGELLRNVHPNYKNIRRREILYFHFTTTKFFITQSYNVSLVALDQFCFNARQFVSCRLFK